MADDQRVLALSVPPTLAAIGEVQAALRAWLHGSGASAGSIYRAELVAEEMLANIVRHADLPPIARVMVRAARADDTLRIEVVDPGPAFDPLSQPAPRRASNLADVEPGGLGLPLIRSMSLDLQYERTQEGLNRFVAIVSAA